MPASQDSPVGPKIGPRVPHYENPVQKVSVVTVEFQTHTKHIYVNDVGARGGVLFFQGGRVLLVQQWRYLTRDLAWEIPGGKIEAGEEPDTGAAREAMEETGLKCLRLKPLVFFIPGLDCSDNPTHVFLCTEFEACSAKDGAADPHEISGGKWLPLEECLRMVFDQRIVDSMTITALLALQAALSGHAPGLK